ncbi:MAG: oxidoreductase [Dehalococcoidia bacterium]|jgi:F420-non-reducing hydrogenase small subunit
MPKLKLALYWASSCGGCEIGQLQIGTKLLKLVDAADIVFWPVAIDVKYKDVEAMPSKSIDVCLFNGSIRTSEQEHMAKMLREKSNVLISYGSCACNGGIPGLANFYNKDMIFNRAYIETPSTDNSGKTMPQTSFETPQGVLTLPEFYETVRSLAQTVDVDYYIPGCPPEERTTWLALEALIEGKLPPKGTVISNNVKAVCDDCPRKKNAKKIKSFYRTFQMVPEPEICLLEQGLICAGVATRGGCGAPCPQANMPCTGCYGAPDGVTDQGAHLLGAVASVIDSTDPEEINNIIDNISDPAGTFYRYSLPVSLLRRAKVK